MENFELHPIGTVRSPLKSRKDCPLQEREGAPEAWIEIDPAYAKALEGLEVGNEVLVLTWMHLANRNILKVHPRGNRQKPERGVFTTRSPNRPNPIGLHQTHIVAMEEPFRIKVGQMETVDGTPVLDIKSVL